MVPPLSRPGFSTARWIEPGATLWIAGGRATGRGSLTCPDAPHWAVGAAASDGRDVSGDPVVRELLRAGAHRSPPSAMVGRASRKAGGGTSASPGGLRS